MNSTLPFVFLTGLLFGIGHARDVRPEMEQAERFGRDASSLLLRNDVRPFWADQGSTLVYRVNTERDGHRFFQVDLKSGAKSPAFDHDALAKALAAAASQQVSASKLPLEQVELTGESGIVRFRAFGRGWRYDAAKAEATPDSVPPKPAELMAPEEAMRAARSNVPSPPKVINKSTCGRCAIAASGSQADSSQMSPIPAIER